MADIVEKIGLSGPLLHVFAAVSIDLWEPATCRRLEAANNLAIRVGH